MEEAWSLDWNKKEFTSLVRSSCTSLSESSPHVTIDSDALAAFAASLTPSSWVARPQRAFPLNFPTPRSEINFLTILALLNIGSGWRDALHAQRDGHGASETITFGCMGMHISGEITADTMINITLTEVAQLFSIKTHEDYEISRGIHSERPTPLYSLAETIRRILNDSGSMLKNLSCADFSEFFTKFTPKISEIDPVTNEPIGPSVDVLIARLVRHFKWLQDAYVLKGAAAAAAASESSSSSSAAAASSSSSSSSSSTTTQSGSPSPRVIYILKKAQLICASLYARFHDDSNLSSTFGFSDISSLTICADNVIPAVLRAKGVLKYSNQLAAAVDAGTTTAVTSTTTAVAASSATSSTAPASTPPAASSSSSNQLKNREQEAAIRAVAIVACERIVAQLNSKTDSTPSKPVTAMQLDYYLWSIGKEPDLRVVKRHATQSGFY